MGYQALETEASGNVMLAPTFLKVSESNEVTLADLKVSGYDAPVWEKQEGDTRAKNHGGVVAGKFAVSTLTTGGTQDKGYQWIDYWKSASVRVGPGWFDAKGNEIEGGAESVKLPSGKGLWIQGSGFSLQPAGAVNPFDIAYKTVDSGSVAIGNCTPVELTLADLTVTGYDAPVWEKQEGDTRAKNHGGVVAGKFAVSTLTTGGTQDKGYQWIDYWKSASVRVGPGWFDAKGNEIEGGAESVKIPAGKGLWIQGSGNTLIIPAPEL